MRAHTPHATCRVACGVCTVCAIVCARDTTSCCAHTSCVRVCTLDVVCTLCVCVHIVHVCACVCVNVCVCVWGCVCVCQQLVKTRMGCVHNIHIVHVIHMQWVCVHGI